MTRKTDNIPHKKALLIICEGSNTEPIFFSNFISKEDGFVFDISPKPKLSRRDLETSANRGGRKRQKRQLRGEGNAQEEIPITGPPPLSWINAAEREFDTYEEIWCVFDKDNHPKCQDAFVKAEQIKGEGHNLIIAFSSISIEYFFLLHFEYIYKAFNKSECKVSKKKKANCLLPNAIPGYACLGDKCVNGYARLKGYWTESKSDENIIYPLLKDKLFVGIKNAELLRRESDEKQSSIVFYERNPYTNVDYLIARLLGYSILEDGTPISTKIDSTRLSISKKGEVITITNDGITSVAEKDSFLVSENGSAFCVSTPLLLPKESILIELPGNPGDIYFVNCINDRIIIIK